MNGLFVLNSILLGTGLAMDAFSVSIADGLNDPDMDIPGMCVIAGTFGFFQFMMPLAGWACVRQAAIAFSAFRKYIPFIAFALLMYIGGKMILEALRPSREEEERDPYSGPVRRMDPRTLLLQGVATSIDALSVGFTIASYPGRMALCCSMIIAAVTFGLCMGGLLFGRKLGERFASRSGMLGGCILAAIGLEILIRGLG